MLQLLSTFWFIALAALLVPVLIHFWNKKEPKIIKVGSIKWLAASASKKARSFRFQDWPLLLLRCSLLAALVMFLVQPVWKNKLTTLNQKYVWIAPELLQNSSLPLIQNTLDSLVKQKYELRQLTNDFALITPEDWVDIKQGDLVIKNPVGAADYWTLVNSLNYKFNSAAEHLIFTSNQLAHFTGSRPQLNANLKWIIIPVRKQKIWVQDAFFTGPDSLTVWLGSSSSTGTIFSNYTFATPASNQSLTIAGAPALLFTRTDKQAFIATPDSPGKVLVKAGVLNITVFFDRSRETDVNYVRAALTALRSYTRRPISLNLVTNTQEINTKTDLLFWLSDNNIPTKVSREIAHGLLIFRDAPDLSKNISATWLTVAGLPEPIRLNKQAPISRDNNFRKWQNNYGESVLHFIPEGKGGTYYFASRFNSQWNSLPESSFFPEILSSLLWQEPVLKQDAREIAESQMQPQFKNAPRVRNAPNLEVRELKYWFILLAALLFLMERIWVYQKAKIGS